MTVLSYKLSWVELMISTNEHNLLYIVETFHGRILPLMLILWIDSDSQKFSCPNILQYSQATWFKVNKW